MADKDRARIEKLLEGKLRSRETILAIFPFTQAGKRPKAPGDKRSDRVLEGVYQSVKRYRPLVLTDQRLFVFDARRVGTPTGVLAEFPKNEVTVSDITPGNLGVTRFVLDLPGLGRVPFEGGRKEEEEVERLTELFSVGS